MSETQSPYGDPDPLDNQLQEIEEPDPLEYSTQMGLNDPEEEQVPEEAKEFFEALSRIPQANEVILPVIMRKGDTIGVLGDAVFDSNTNKMVVSFNTPDGRNIAEFIGSGVLASISFSAQMARNEATNKLN